MSPDNTAPLRFVDELPAAAPANAAAEPWRVLVVDDDPDVHQATRFALGGRTLLGRPLELLHAYSAAQSRQMLEGADDLALVLLDVVMETESAGLELIDDIRGRSALQATRIVLRTGQAGYAPEHETILRYDINDYKTKAELTHHRLITTVTSALRCYDQLRVIEAGRRGLAQIVEANRRFMAADSLPALAREVLAQLAALPGGASSGLVCEARAADPGEVERLAGLGRYAGPGELPLALSAGPAGALVRRAIEDRHAVQGEAGVALYLGERAGHPVVAYVEPARPADPTVRPLLEVLGANAAAALRNLTLLVQLRQQAFFDPLLGLPNRTRLIEHIDEALRRGANTALALVDIDDFAGINDLMGHAYGDAVLAAFAVRLRSRFGADVIVARMNSNTFGLLGPAPALDPQAVAQAVHEPLVVEGRPQQLSVTSGFGLLVGGIQGGSEWLKDVSIALKHAKRHLRGRHAVFTPALGSEARGRAELLASLHAAFADTRLFLVYQPQLDLQDGRLVGLEALLRWRTDDGRMVPPAEFIPVAEQSGLIVPLGDWVLDSACREMRALVDAGRAPDRMAVNVSVHQFQLPDFAARVEAALARHHLPGERLELEITESVAVLGMDAVGAKLTTLRAHGVSIALDDFGTGYSSLSYLGQLPIDRLKIDRAFVIGMGRPASPPIAELIAELGARLGLRVVAEGVETQAVAERLGAIGVHEGQGYWFAKPMESPALAAWLESRT